LVVACRAPGKWAGGLVYCASGGPRVFQKVEKMGPLTASFGGLFFQRGENPQGFRGFEFLIFPGGTLTPPG